VCGCSLMVLLSLSCSCVCVWCRWSCSLMVLVSCLCLVACVVACGCSCGVADGVPIPTPYPLEHETTHGGRFSCTSKFFIKKTSPLDQYITICYTNIVIVLVTLLHEGIVFICYTITSFQKNRYRHKGVVVRGSHSYIRD
jgi:hypothetical protein